MKAFVAILDHLSYGTLKCCWWSLGNVWKTITRVKEAREHKSLGRWKLAKAREHMRLGRRWYFATKQYKAYRDQVGVFNPEWHFTVARELKYCQQKKEEERRGEEEKKKKTRMEKRRKVEDERRRKELLQKGRIHRKRGRWELAITLFRLYLNDEGADLDTCIIVRAELHDCQQKKSEEDWRENATEDERKKNVEHEQRRTSRGVLSVGFSGSFLQRLEGNGAECKALCDLFNARWIKPRPENGVSIVRIFSIQVSREVREKHERYKGKFGNLCQRFHGTSCNEGCNFMVDPQGGQAPCGESSCSVCNICKLGFQLGPNVARTARATRFPLRYGAGIYLTSVSGKANDYASRSAKKVGELELRCMFVASVALGNTFKTTSARLPADQCPPPGYHSVVGEAGQRLNFDEFVVYKEEAALPTHLIVYALRH
ncbi:conserved unknown protein [Ectocarpus siliculosus]|uniref:PARP catalytic domain-containing protein n=1 Tax=Ectocarpus siliculosus TaxID=2880 RepID=D7FXR2_ECTSI|nr:conserved unknown protein [Ectocarpus siliculosus]|eukprot:CBJ32325.1 conserved unknown protein [Ectocarpus siliculosus]